LEEYETFTEKKWWEEDPKTLCPYCGKDITKSESDYCSIDCEKEDSVWHRIN
jgi:predicted amidophosphoribosyltransferase